MPIYEYKCPNGHLLEVFHGMNEPGPTACEVCGASPLVKVLHPVAGLPMVDHVLGAVAETGLTRLPVVERTPERKLIGIVSIKDLLRGRERNMEEERRRERVLRISLLLNGRAKILKRRVVSEAEPAKADQKSA